MSKDSCVSRLMDRKNAAADKADEAIDEFRKIAVELHEAGLAGTGHVADNFAGIGPEMSRAEQAFSDALWSLEDALGEAEET